MENNIMKTNSKVENLMENKDFVLEILKKPNAEEVKKAFAGRGVNLDQKDVDSLGAALNNILSIVSKYSPKEIDKMANMFETMDSASLAKVAGGIFGKQPTPGEIVKNAFANACANVLTGRTQEDINKLYTFLRDIGGIDQNGNFTEVGRKYLRDTAGLGDTTERLIGTFVDKLSNRGAQPQPAPAQQLYVAGSSAGGENNNGYMYAGIGAAAVSACALAYMFKNEIKSLFK